MQRARLILCYFGFFLLFIDYVSLSSLVRPDSSSQLPMPFVLAKMQAASDAMKKMKTEHLDAIAEMESSCVALYHCRA
jgi:hypothetical protein